MKNSLPQSLAGLTSLLDIITPKYFIVASEYWMHFDNCQGALPFTSLDIDQQGFTLLHNNYLSCPVVSEITFTIQTGHHIEELCY